MKYVTIWIAALAAIACGLLLCESHFLWKAQELNLFLDTPLFFKQQMVVPAGILTYIGTWFTQFFYHPWMGVMLLCGWWLLLLFLLKKTFAVPARWASLLLIPVALLLLTNVDMGYWLYILKLRGHFFLTTIATTAVVALLWGYRSLPDKFGLRAIWMVITGIVGYPLLGIYGLAATLLMGIWSWRLMPRGRAAIYTLIAILLVVAVPPLCYRHVYHEINYANIYYAGLPLFYITERYTTYYIPYYLLLLFMVVMVCLPQKAKSEKPAARSEQVKENAPAVKEEQEQEKAPAPKGKQAKGKANALKNKPEKANIPPSKNKPEKKQHFKTWLPLVAEAAALALIAWGVVHFWYKDSNFHRELSMQHSIEQLDWEGVLKEAATQDDEPTRAIVMMRNLALWRLGRQAEMMYQFPNGAKPYNGPSEIGTMMVVGPMIYYQYGMLNSCNRLSTEMGVEFDWRAEHLKNMVRSALLNGEKPIAQKYIGLLKHTMFFGEWAAKAENLLNNPQLIAKDREMEPITHMLHFSDVLSSEQGNVERFLMSQLARIHYPDDPVFQEQALLASMWLKDPSLFWRHFDTYVSLHPNSPIPVAYQEAAYLFCKEANLPDTDKMPFSQGVKDSFEKFFESISQYEGMDVKKVREKIGTFYNNTFYYDYYLMSNLPEY